MKCEFCGNKTKASWGLCQGCKSARHHGGKRVEAEGLIVDKAGADWWVWDKKGEVLVLGQSSRRNAIIALIKDPVDSESTETEE